MKNSCEPQVSSSVIPQSHAGRRAGKIYGWLIWWLVALGVAGLIVENLRPKAYTPSRFTAQGNSKEIGEAIGKRYARPMAGNAVLLRRLIKAHTNVSDDQLHADVHKLAKHVDKVEMEEMKAMAKSADLTLEDVLIVNFFYSLSHTINGCRQLAAWGPKSREGKLIHGRNLDWSDYPGSPLRKHVMILNIRGDDQVPYVILTWPGVMGALTGTNQAGITLGFNFLSRTAGRKEFSEPTFFTLKRVLRSCENLEQAVQLIKKAKPLDNGSVLISSAGEKKAVVVEIIDGKVGVRPAEDDRIGNANHATKESGLAAHPKVPSGDPDLPTCHVLDDLKKPITVKQMQAILADPAVMAATNLQSVVFVPADNLMLLSSGQYQAAKASFQSYKLFDKPWKPTAGKSAGTDNASD